MFFAVLLTVFVGSFFISSDVLAQSDFGTGYLSGTELPSDDIRVVIIRIVNVLLGVLGTIFLLLIIYAGWLWMTAGGNPQQVQKAQKYITNAVIGLVIIFMAFAFTRFIFNVLNDTANGGPGGPNSCTDGAISGCNVCIGGTWTFDSSLCTLPGSSFRVRDISTAHNGTDDSQDVHLCSSIQANTNNSINASTITGNVTLTQGGSAVAATISNSSRAIEIEPSAQLAPNTTYIASYGKAIEDASGLSLSGCDPFNCTNAGTTFDWQFTTGTHVDTNAPAVTATSPIYDPANARYPDQNVSRDQVIRVSFSENIRATSIDDGTGVPIGTNFVLQVLDGEAGTVQTTVNNADLEVVTRNNGFDVYWQPPLLFNAFTWFRVTVDGVEDLCGNPMDTPLTWEFQTNDKSPGVGSNYPTGANSCPDVPAITTSFNTSMERDVVSIAISEGAAGNPPVMSAAFRPSDLAPGPYQVNGTGGVLSVDAASDFKVFDFVPASPLNTNTQYFVQVTSDRVIDTDGNVLAHAWDFTVSDASSCACEPYISGINPKQGLKGQCVTVTGQCFKGAVPGDVGDPRHAEPTQLVFNATPATIGGSDNRYLTSSIPTGAVKGDRLIPNVTIAYNDTSLGSIASNNTTVDYYVDSDSVANGPCLFALNPPRACTDDAIALNGIRFGADPGVGNRSTVSENIAMNDTALRVPDAQVTQWSETKANITVPNTAADGGVTISVAGNQSNSIPFDLMCSVGASCDSTPSTPICTDSGACGAGLFCDSARSCTCQRVVVVSPELPVVTSKYPTCSLSCTNAFIGAEFNHDIDPGTLTASSVEVYPCGSDCSVVNLASKITVSYDINPRDVVIRPTGNLAADTTYRVLLRDSIARPTGETLAGLNFDFSEDGTRDSYSWTFSTKDTECAVDGVTISPIPASAGRLNQEVRFSGYAEGSNAQCGRQRISSSSQNWTWSSSNTAVATVSQVDSDGDTNVDARQNATALDNGTTNITAGIGSFTAFSELTVDILACKNNTDCAKLVGGVNQCAGSTCDLASGTCTPVITGLSPNSGPVGRWTTVQGCYFGSSKGTSGEVLFDTTAAVYPACSGGAWGNSSIIVEVPTGVSGTVPVTVETNRGLTTNAQNFSVTAQCSGQPIPSGGIPSICRLSPSSGAIQQDITVVGERFGAGNAADTISFTTASGAVNAPSDSIDSWTDSQIQTSVHSSAVTGDVTVTVDQCPSNGVVYTVTTTVGSACDSDTVATSCQASDSMCGAGNTGLYCETASCTCQPAPAPTVMWSSPFGTGANACRNTIAQVVFDSLMDHSTLNNNSIRIEEDTTGTVLSGVRLRTYTVNSMADERILGSPNTSQPPFDALYDRTVVDIIPNGILAPNTNHSIVVTVDVENAYAQPIAAEYDNTFRTQNEICEIDHIELTVTPPGSVTNDDFFTCAGINGCPDDQDGQAGNQHTWVAQAYDNATPPNALTANYTWTENGSSNLYTLSNSNAASTLVTAEPRDGSASFYVNAQFPGYGNATTTMRSENFICENPWPDFANFPYYESASDFATFYCRDKGVAKVCLDNGGAVKGRSCSDGANCGSGSCVSGVCVDDFGNALTQCGGTSECNGNGTSYTCSNDPQDDLTSLGIPVEQNGPPGITREVFFFPVDHGGDVIAIQVYDNAEFLNPSVWYLTNVPNPGSPQSITVDGYAAIRDGRTVYVSAARNTGGNSYSALIYLISYNDGAHPDVVSIYNQLVDNWHFTTGVTDITESEQIRRDTQRITDLGAMKELLVKYKDTNGVYPTLTSGTFQTGMSTSQWPSWTGELSSLLGATLSKDPLNTFSQCPAAGTPNPERYEQSSCWNKTDRLFDCADGSHIYQYHSNRAGFGNGAIATLYANLELDSVTWPNLSTTSPPPAGSADSCRDFSISIN